MPNVAIVTVLLSAVISTIGTTSCRAGHFHCRLVKSKCCVPKKFAYRRSTPAAVSVLASEIAIAAEFSTRLVKPPGGARVPEVYVTNKRFVFDDIAAGPIQLTRAAAMLAEDGHFYFTAVLMHSGGDSGQLLGGKAVIRIEALAALPTGQSNPAAPVTWHTTREYWVIPGQPTMIDLDGIVAHTSDFSNISNIQVYLAQYPSR